MRFAERPVPATLMPVQLFGDAGQSVDQYFQIVGEQNYPRFSRIHRGRWAKSSRGNSHFMIPLQRRISLMALTERGEPSRRAALYTRKRDLSQLSKHTGLSIAPCLL
jgi:hypothetical protein